MNCANIQFGSQIAQEVPSSSSSADALVISTPTTLSDLMAALEKKQLKSISMLRTTASLVADCIGLSFEQINLDRVFEIRSEFRRFLEKSPYKENSIRSYVNYVGILIRLARRLGWRPGQNLPEEWQQVIALAVKKKCTDVVGYFARMTKSPKEVTQSDLEVWAESRLQHGTTYKTVRDKKRRFWRLLMDCGVTGNLPLSITRSKTYGISVAEYPQQLRAEVEGLIKWKTSDFSLDRPKGGQIRQETADTIRKEVSRLLGFAVKLSRQSGINSLRQLVNKEIIAEYVTWCINERGVKGATLHNHLGRLDVAMRQHPSYASLDLKWFKTLLESLPIEPDSERKARKAKKYLDYPAIEAIPRKILAERHSTAKGNADRIAELAMEEFLIKFLTALPWRQRNIRESRIGGANPNIFKAPVPNYIVMDKPSWVHIEEKKNPGTAFWQIHFRPIEIKTGQRTGKDIRAILPRPLVKPLEEYLAAFRPKLIKSSDPGTLFVTKNGRAMTRHYVHDLVSRVSLRYGGKRVNPHLFRDIVAFAWLKAHPKDYLTLSKILWHANINVTIKTYGSQFDESSGICAMEEWLEEREARSKSK